MLSVCINEACFSIIWKFWFNMKFKGELENLEHKPQFCLFQKKWILLAKRFLYISFFCISRILKFILKFEMNLHQHKGFDIFRSEFTTLKKLKARTMKYNFFGWCIGDHWSVTNEPTKNLKNFKSGCSMLCY